MLLQLGAAKCKCKHVDNMHGCKQAACMQASSMYAGYQAWIQASKHTIMHIGKQAGKRQACMDSSKQFVVLTLVAAALAAPQQNPQDVQILRYDLQNGSPDSYSFAWELSDGSKHEEQGQLKNQGTENEGIAVQGQYAWVGPDGVRYVVTYIADENGFQPTIEQGPGGAVPPAIVAKLVG